ncbi:hypothetical protein FRC09_016384 [Ceratobasidium sp. 395]|nr:hypothetical protein FRC09_016384 [Ceratobasidium sp. 395]
MNSQRNILWGPGIDQYSHDFNGPRVRDVSESSRNLYRTYNLPSLARLESMLFKSNPRTGEIGFVNLGDAIEVLRRYKNANPRKIFENYYGYLCVQHLLYITCLAMLEVSGTVREFLATLPRDASWVDTLRSMAVYTTELVGRETENPASLSALAYKIWDVVKFFGHEQPDNFSLVLATLREDRQTFFMLCKRGCFPGCSLFLLVCSQLVRIIGDENPDICYQDRLHLQDVAFRLYLTGSYRDRQLIQVVGTHLVEENVAWRNGTLGYLGHADVRIVSNAFSDLLVTLQQDKLGTKNIPASFLASLSRFVQNLATYCVMDDIEVMMDVTYISLQLLWTVFEHKGRVKPIERCEVRSFATINFDYVKFIHRECVQTEEQTYRFAQLLAKTDLFSLAGRALLLGLDEGRNTLAMNDLLNQITELRDGINTAIIAAPELLLDQARPELLKVAMQLEQATGCEGTGRSRHETVGLVEKMKSAWTAFGSPLKAKLFDGVSALFNIPVRFIQLTPV